MKANLRDEYLVIDADDRLALKAELDGRRATYEGDGPFQVPLDAREAQRLIRELKTPLTVLKTHSPSLEDAYLRLVGTAME